MATLAQFWTAEVARLDAALADTAAQVQGSRSALQTAEQQERAASDALRLQEGKLRDARAALALIAMPGDGDPQLAAMDAALVARAEAVAAAANASQRALTQRARLDRLGATLASLQTERQHVAAEKLNELGDGTPQRPGQAASRQKMMALLLAGGALENLAADAAQALIAFEADARNRVEGEFPSNGAAPKDFLKRVRARRSLINDSVQAVDGAAKAQAPNTTALAAAQRAFDTCLGAVRRAADAAPLLTADTTTLAALAALPAPTATTRPVLTIWQHKRLHDATQQALREAALALLADVDDAWKSWRNAQKAYDDALHTAMKANPDMTPLQLDAVPAVKSKLDTLALKAADLATKTGLLAPQQAIAQGWLACVSDALWDALDRLDGAIDRLKDLGGITTPAQRITDLLAAETGLAAALDAAGLAARQKTAALAAQARAAENQGAEHETRVARLRGAGRSAALL